MSKETEEELKSSIIVNDCIKKIEFLDNFFSGRAIISL